MILHVSDFHANINWYRWLVRVSSNFELVCLTGDMLDLNPQRPQAEQLDVIVPLLQTVGAPLAVVSGNHDSLPGSGPRLAPGAWLKEVRGQNRWIDGDSFELGCNKYVCVPWLGSYPKAGPEDIWLSHVPPDSATGISKGGAGWGSFDLGEACRSNNGPCLALSGHVHDPQSWRSQVGHTWSLNPGHSGPTERPNHIVIDLDRGIASRHLASGEIDFLKL